MISTNAEKFATLAIRGADTADRFREFDLEAEDAEAPDVLRRPRRARWPDLVKKISSGPDF